MPPMIWASRLASGIPGSAIPANMPMTIPPIGPVSAAPVVVKISRGSVTTGVPGIGMVTPASTSARAAPPNAAATPTCRAERMGLRSLSMDESGFAVSYLLIIPVVWSVSPCFLSRLLWGVNLKMVQQEARENFWFKRRIVIFHTPLL